MNMSEISNATSAKPAIMDRVGRLVAGFAAVEIDGLLAGTESNRHYLSGFAGSAGSLLVTPQRRVLITDGRYTEQAGMQAPDYEIVIHTGPILEQVAATVTESGVRRLGFDPGTTTVAAFQDLAERLGEGIELVATPGMVETLRQVKDEHELTIMRRAIGMADDVLAMVERVLVPGAKERDVATQIEHEFRTLGAQKTSFDAIVATGTNGAMPHHLPDDTVVQAGEPVVVDIGGIVDGYCSDITRTFCPGGRTAHFDEIYAIVLEAEEAAIAGVAVGMGGWEVDALARAVIADAGYGEYFGHGTGHGVGIDVHEAPRLAESATDTLEAGMVHSIEPGIYLPEWGGVRIEDLLLVTADGVEVLTAAPK